MKRLPWSLVCLLVAVFPALAFDLVKDGNPLATIVTPEKPRAAVSTNRARWPRTQIDSDGETE